ncbi:hypothetical protein HDU97_003106 [Phlyctochytrium planicorne]|nr:hypothetical protein HDU97_003058 [Phlyctochytrium planicorne]KAJ3109678.1 hypothetical protein HDU97_003106 [Phlyctochytrium planicorne]
MPNQDDSDKGATSGRQSPNNGDDRSVIEDRASVSESVGGAASRADDQEGSDAGESRRPSQKRQSEGGKGRKDAEMSEDEDEDTAEALLDSIITRAAEAEASTKGIALSKLGAPEEEGSGEAYVPSDPSEAALMEDLQSTLNFLAGGEEKGGQEGGAGMDENATTRIRHEYDKLHRLFMQSRKNEQSLLKKCKDLTTELSANAAKVQAALKLSQNERSTIASLKKEVKKAWKMVEIGNDKENRAKEAIARLKMELEQVKKQIDDGTAEGGGNTTFLVSGGFGGGYSKMMEAHMDQEETIKKLTHEKEHLIEQLDIAQSDMSVLQSEIQELNQKITGFLAERASVDQDMHTLKDLLSTKKSEQDREQRAREKLELSVRQANDTLTRKDAEIATKQGEIRTLKETVNKLEIIVRDEKMRLEKESKEKESLNGKIQRLQSDYDEQQLTSTRLQTENQNQSAEIKSWEEELNKYKEEYKSMARVKDSLQKRIKGLEDGKTEAEVERDNLRNINNSLLHEHETLKRDLDSLHKQLENITRERDIAQKNFVKATGATQKQLNAVKLAEQTKRNLEQEIMAYKDEASKMRKLIYSLEKDRDRHINEASKVTQNLTLKEEDIKIKEMMIFDSRKKITELERKLKEQQSLYENVRADRNLYSKNLIESQDEITEMKRKLKIMSHQIEQLKEEISNKETSLAKEHFEHAKLEKEKESLSSQIAKLQQMYEEGQQQIQNQQAEENKLRHIISEADAERVRQKKEYDSLVQERDILGTQLIRRNDELSLLYEKIKIQTSTLNKGEIQYRERLEDIRVLKLEIKKLRREKAILQTETQNVEGLRNEIFKLQREILRERTRVKVLEEELESPMNIHRWRKLSGSDPSTYELITKIQTLQKRLIAKTEEVVEKELIINQKEKLYKEIKDVLQRQPGPEIVEELRVVKEAVKTKVRECKSLASELNMYHSQVNEYKYEIERLNRDLQTLKKKYFEQKKRDREERLARLKMEKVAMASERIMGGQGAGGDVALEDKPRLLKAV